MAFRRGAHGILFVLLCLLQLLNALDLTEEREPEGPLGVRVDYALAIRNGKEGSEQRHQWAFSSHLKFPSTVSGATDGQLTKMAKDAYKEMTSNFKQYGPKGPNDEYPNHTPMVMTLLAFGNEIILGSSQRGTLAFIDGKAGNPALDNLNLCRILFTEVTSIRPPDVAGEPDMTQHKNTRHCGEVLSMYHFHELHDGEDIGKYEKPRIVSIIRVRNTITKITRLIILDPCGVTPPDEEGKWGCKFFLDQRYKAIQVIDKDTEDEDYVLDEIAGGQPVIKSLNVCDASA